MTQLRLTGQFVLQPVLGRSILLPPAPQSIATAGRAKGLQADSQGWSEGVIDGAGEQRAFSVKGDSAMNKLAFVTALSVVLTAPIAARAERIRATLTG